MGSVKAQEPRDILRAMVDMIRPARARARALVVPRWRLDLARASASASGDGMVDLGRKLAAAVKRAEPWNHGTVSKFLAGKLVTDEMVEAFVTLYSLPRPVYYPRDAAEALMFRAAEESRSKRLADADDAISAVEREVGRHTDPVGSGNGVQVGKRRAATSATRRG